MLIGGDLYQQLLTGASYPTEEEELFFVPTKFGLVVSSVIHDMAVITACYFSVVLNPVLKRNRRLSGNLRSPRGGSILSGGWFSASNTSSRLIAAPLMADTSSGYRTLGNNKESRFRFSSIRTFSDRGSPYYVATTTIRTSSNANSHVPMEVCRSSRHPFVESMEKSISPYFTTTEVDEERGVIRVGGCLQQLFPGGTELLAP